MRKVLKTMRVLLVAVLLGVGVGNVWGDTTIFSMSGVTGFSGTQGTDYNGPGSYGSDKTAYTIADGYLGVIAGKTVTLTGGTITGGTAKVYNGHGSKGNLTLNTSTGVVSISNSGNSYLFITLSSGTIQEGDVISLSGYKDSDNSSFYICNSSTKSTTVSHSFATSSYTVPSGSGLIGKSSVYFWNNKGATISSITITRPAVAPGAISFSPAAGTVAQGTSVTLTSTNATTIEYKWSSAAIGSEGDWTGAETYSDSNKPIVPVAGSSNTVLSVKATNANGSTYGSASYTPAKMALKTIYSFADGIGSETKTESNASITESQMSITGTAGRLILTAATGFQFKNGDAISFSGSVGNISKPYGIKYGPTTDLGTDLYVAAGAACNVSGTLTLASATSSLYIGRYETTTNNFTSFTIRQLTTATSITYTGVKISGSASTEGEDYSKEGTVITLDGTFATAPNVALTSHIVFTDASEEDQDVDVVFGDPDGEFFTGTATVDGTEYTVKAPCANITSLKVQYKSGGTLIKEESLDVTGLKVGASYTVPFRMYIEKDGALYQTTANSKPNAFYGDAVTLEYNTIVTKSLSTVDLGGGTIELFEDLDDNNGNNASVRASNCSAYVNKAYISTNNLPAGIYNFILKAQNQDRGSSIKVGDVTIFTASDKGKGSWNNIDVSNVIIPVASKLTFVTTDALTRYDDYDIIIAIRIGEVASIGSYGYATFSSTYALDFTDVTDATAYIATDKSGSNIRMQSVTGTVAANTGLVLKSSTGSSANVAIPRAESGTYYNTTSDPKNYLFAINSDYDLTKPGEGTNYVLTVQSEKVVFAPIGDTAASVTAGHAALWLPADVASKARALSLSFDDETTSIDSVKSEETIVKSFFNLNGQRISKPTKGLYIVNGKKVIIK